MKKKIIGVLMAIVAMLGGYEVNEYLQGVSYVETRVALNAVAATTTSSAIDISGAERVSFLFEVASMPVSGKATTTFTVTASVDGSTYKSYSKLVDNVTNTNVQGLTRVASEALGVNGTAISAMDLEHDTFKFIKVTSTTLGTTTSSNTATVLIDY